MGFLVLVGCGVYGVYALGYNQAHMEHFATLSIIMFFLSAGFTAGSFLGEGTNE